ncbi:Vitamin B12 import ATP-binding protein BtuD [Planctomycetes bacterium LzC2]|uniref:Vitamin B12 import ATP-binding protein BtuD n=2 Tax=Alienimonas chondri TaxID=2681879 RepID=A0ABX1VBM0_9PLAN|nr:ATP-binding cassette domain-containing protein [Alienimonas chondri]NNJ25346.1 Vitamin B12 import ATP-binding protein BtuD [Alienimonas chondri]
MTAAAVESPAAPAAVDRASAPSDPFAEESANAPTPGGPRAMIEAKGLSKFYGPFAAVRDVSFSVPEGQVCAFLGPNGAGKSTTMRMLTGFLAPSAGAATVGGHDVAEARIDAARTLGYLPENGPLYQEMSPAAFLSYVGKARGMASDRLKPRLEAMKEACSLAPVWGKPIAKLSRGYRQRVGMAQALLHDPSVLILDEPTGGLDPNQVAGVRELIGRLRDEGKTLLISTHILREVRAVCDRVLLISAGRLVFDGSADDLAGSEEEMEAKFRELTASPQGRGERRKA